MNFDTPQETVKMQLKNGVRYVTSMAYGGHGALFRSGRRNLTLTSCSSRHTANQFISIQKMLYFAKLTNRVGIV